jgi:hypothetical protein
MKQLKDVVSSSLMTVQFTERYCQFDRYYVEPLQSTAMTKENAPGIY